MLEHCHDLSPLRRDSVLAFYSALLRENEIQNLTRLTAPQDFLEGHLLDARALLESGLVSFPAMDLGSGCGVPGLLAAVLTDQGKWVLAESEGRKAEFLEGAPDIKTESEGYGPNRRVVIKYVNS
jgi:16S rRNA (guanine527-N7)-methyltransferase